MGKEIGTQLIIRMNRAALSAAAGGRGGELDPAGSLLIDEAEFTRRFPRESGYRMFLMDAPSNSVAEVSATLSRALQDAGGADAAAQAAKRVNAVQEYLPGHVQILGGLGLLLAGGSASW